MLTERTPRAAPFGHPSLLILILLVVDVVINPKSHRYQMLSFAETTELFWGLVGPWIFLWNAFTFLPGTVLRLVCTGDVSRLLSRSRLQDAWFGAFWGCWGPRIREENSDRMVALLEGRVSKAEVVEEAVHPHVSGVVLEIGPGSGLWVNLFAAAAAAAAGAGGGGGGRIRRRVANGVTRVYGIEPNAEAHPMLKKRVAEAGLEDTYEIVPVGIESLNNGGGGGGDVDADDDSTAAWRPPKIEKGSVDCIVSILSLCSIPDPEKNIPELYSYLKKGGRWYLYEHVEVSYNWPLRLYQRIVNLVWPRVLNGCQLCRNTRKTLKNAGPWEKIDVAQPPIEPWYQIVPHIFGTLTK